VFLVLWEQKELYSGAVHAPTLPTLEASFKTLRRKMDTFSKRRVTPQDKDFEDWLRNFGSHERGQVHQYYATLLHSVMPEGAEQVWPNGRASRGLYERRWTTGHGNARRTRHRTGMLEWRQSIASHMEDDKVRLFACQVVLVWLEEEEKALRRVEGKLKRAQAALQAGCELLAGKPLQVEARVGKDMVSVAWHCRALQANEARYLVGTLGQPCLQHADYVLTATAAVLEDMLQIFLQVNGEVSVICAVLFNGIAMEDNIVDRWCSDTDGMAERATALLPQEEEEEDEPEETQAILDSEQLLMGLSMTQLLILLSRASELCSVRC
jgi:hypothetical protein